MMKIETTQEAEPVIVLKKEEYEKLKQDHNDLLFNHEQLTRSFNALLFNFNQILQQNLAESTELCEPKRVPMSTFYNDTY